MGLNKQRGFLYDSNYKGILEILVDEEEYLCGAVLHWPNGLESRYERLAEGSRSMNVIPVDGKLETLVGQQYSPHDPFSPLLRLGETPRYTNLRGVDTPLKWADA